MFKIAKVLVVALLALTLVAISFGAGFGLAGNTSGVKALPSLGPAISESSPLNTNLLGEVWQILQEEFVKRDALDPSSVSEGAVKGMLESLGDPHTSYISPEQLRLEQQSIRGSYEGIGAFVNLEGGRITIIAPISGSPAERAGIKPGDMILEIDGRSTVNLTLAQAVAIIQGPRGTKVLLTILHKGEKEPTKLEIVRDTIRTTSVLSRMLEDDIAYLRISHFSQSTNDDTVKALKELRDKRPKGLIVDLRSNPGGLLETTVDVTSQFLKSGVVLLQEDNKGRRQTWNVRSGGLVADIPMVVLVDGNSASGSEVMAGAIQDHKRGVLIGEKTYGKGSVNHTRPLSNGGAVYVTIAYWLTPNGTQIDGQGLIPDIEIKLTEEDIQKGIDAQMERAIQYLKTGK